MGGVIKRINEHRRYYMHNPVSQTFNDAQGRSAIKKYPPVFTTLINLKFNVDHPQGSKHLTGLDSHNESGYPKIHRSLKLDSCALLSRARHPVM